MALPLCILTAASRISVGNALKKKKLKKKCSTKIPSQTSIPTGRPLSYAKWRRQLEAEAKLKLREKFR
jgi:hypothetical protein